MECQHRKRYHPYGSRNSGEWEIVAIQGVQNWMRDHASELDINVDTELFLDDTVRTAVHDNGDTIQLHIPPVFIGVPVVGARAMASIKLGNLINVGFENWGTVPRHFGVNPVLTAGEARADGATHYHYKLVWRVCPVFEGQEREQMEGLVNARTGKVYSFVVKVHYLQAIGGVFPTANKGRSLDGVEQPN
jgi:hypothetical protein